MVLVQNWPFFHLFLGNIGQENLFYDIIEEKKNIFLYKKKKVQKVEKVTFFQRAGHFSTFFFWQYRPGKCVV